MPPQRFDRAWKLGVSVVLLGILAWTQDLGSVLSLMAAADPGWLAVAILAMMAGQTLTAFTWGLLLTARELRVPLGKLVNIYYMSSFIGTWLPSSTGPDVVRAYYLAKHVDGYEAVGSMLVLRFISLLTLGLFAVVGIGLVPAESPELPASALLLAWLLVAGSAGALIVGMTDGPRWMATRVLRAIGLGGLGNVLGKLHDALSAYRRAPGALAVATMMSLVVQLLRILEIYYAGRALGAEVPLAQYLVLVPVTTLITLIPVSLAGLGVREGAFVYYFSRAGTSPEMAFSLGLLVFGLTLVLWVIGAVLYWRAKPPAAAPDRFGSTPDA
jgi:hypothetical protein